MLGCIDNSFESWAWLPSRVKQGGTSALHDAVKASDYGRLVDAQARKYSNPPVQGFCIYT
jgi:hypothetical protein